MGVLDDPEYDEPGHMRRSPVKKPRSSILSFFKRAAEKIGVEINVTKDIRGDSACIVADC